MSCFQINQKRRKQTCTEDLQETIFVLLILFCYFPAWGSAVPTDLLLSLEECVGARAGGGLRGRIATADLEATRIDSAEVHLARNNGVGVGVGEGSIAASNAGLEGAVARHEFWT